MPLQIILTCVSALILAAGCSSITSKGIQPPNIVSSRPAPNIILITVDTLRADHMGIYGYPRNTTPNIDAFARKSLVFDNFITVAPSTLPSFASFFTGLYPYSHGVLGTNKFLLQYKLFETYNTLAELLPQYKKIGITGNTWLDEIGGYTKGFNEYKIILHKPLKEPGLHTKKIADEALLQLKLFTKDKPLFFWVHFLKPHAPCNPPKDTASLFKGDNVFTTMEDKKRAKMIAQYDRELFNTDRQVGRVLDYIKDSSYFNNSIIIFFADHGESLGENNYTGHGETLNEATLHIPFIIYIPDTIAGRRDQLLCNVDFLPTLLSLIKTKIPDYVEGKNFAPVISNPSAAEIHDSIFIQNDAIRLNRPYEECLRTKTHKIIKIGERSLQGKNSLPLPDRSKNKFYIYTPLKEEPNLKNFNSPYGIPPENQKRSLDTLSQLFDKNITRLYDFNPVLNESNYSRDQIEELQSLGYLQ